MAEINIDFDKMYQASVYLSSKAYLFSGVRRTVGLSRWKLPENVKEQKNIEERINRVLKQLQLAEQLMTDMKTVTNGCIAQYMQAEEKNNKNANKFI